MSEVATGAAEAAPEAPAVETPEQPKQPEYRGIPEHRGKVGAELRAVERGKAVFDRFKEAVTTTEAADGKVRDPKTGQFVAQENTATSEAALLPPTDGTAGEVVPPVQNTKTEATSPSSVFNVEIPEGHPLRARLTTISATSQQEKEAVQALLNGTYTRPKELEAANARATEAERQANELMEKLIRADATVAAEVEFKASPEYRHVSEKYMALKAAEDSGALPQGTAAEYWEATANQMFQRFRDQKVQGELGKVDEQRAEQGGRAWVQDAIGRTETAYPADVRALPGFNGWIEKSLVEFNALLDHGALGNVPSGNPEALHQAFSVYFGQQIQLKPEFQAVVRNWYAGQEATKRAESDRQATLQREQAEREKSEAAKAAVTDFKRGAAEIRKAVPPNPAASLQHSSALPSPSSVGREPLSAKNQFELQRKATDRAAERARAYFVKRTP